MRSSQALTDVAEFRNRLVTYMNGVLEHAEEFRWGGLDPATARRITADQPWLAQEYGRLFNVINRWGGMMMSSPAAGITSRDVIQDAIHNPSDIFYRDLARLSVQQLDTVIGRLSAESDVGVDPDRLYRWTSPVYWVTRSAAAVRWVLATNQRRIVAAIGAVILTIIGGIASGVAQGWFEQLT